MKRIRSLYLLVSLAGLLSTELCGGTELLPGLTYYANKENLNGKLVFQFSNVTSGTGTNERWVGICEFDLRQKKLRKLTPAPSGLFISSDDGKVFCVLYGLDPVSHCVGTNAFVYADQSQQSRTVHLGAPPRDTVIVDRHVFFQVETNKDTRILDFDFDRGTRQLIELPKASQWEYRDFKNLHAARDTENALHFEYRAFGRRLGDGRDYQVGYYSLDLYTGTISWLTNLDNERFSYQYSDGSYVWFDGRDGPIHGYRLVSSPIDNTWSRIEDPKGKKLKVVKVFSRLAMLTGGTYWLDQMSPCRRYALVRLSEAITQTKSGGEGWVNTYYAVDVSTGETKVLLKDEVRRKTIGFVSHVRWVGGSHETR
jgi:hypothetical protein